MKSYGVWLALGLLAGLLVVGGLVLTRPYAYNGSMIDPPVPAPDFTLQQAGGGEYRLSDQRGKLVVMFFGYTTCPDVCPATLAEMKQVRASLMDKDEQVEYVFVTVDPERDTPERMQQYLAGFDSTFVGLSAPLADLEPVYAGYGVFRAVQEGNSAAGYLVDHTSRVYVIDAQGGLRLTYTFGTPPEDMAADLRQLLKEAS